MSSLSWIADDDLHSAVTDLIRSAHNAINLAEKRMQKNVVDPFSSLMIASTLNIDSKDNLLSIQKTLSGLSGMSNALGVFHQKILGSIQGWENHDTGFDLLNQSEKILAEVKNKHNTMNASNKEKVIADLDVAVRQKGKGWIGYLVVIIPKKPNKYKKKLNTNRPILEIDGASFYELATKTPHALHDLFTVLCNEIAGTNLPYDVKEYCMNLLNDNIAK